jgi:uncharacterized damage-inducible protein DinB
MAINNKPEVWLRGPIEGIPQLLQPVAHALLQATEEVENMIMEFPESQLWVRPAKVASVGFHLKHLKGVLDRLFTYARGESLKEEQLDYLRSEADEEGNPADLVRLFINQVNQSLNQLRNTSTEDLGLFRGVGRHQLPSTVLGLLVHAAEHTMRHVGQLLVTVRIVKGQATSR